MVMHEHDSIVNPETHHEKSDVDVKALLWFVVIFIVFAIVTHLVLWLMFKYFATLARGSTNAPLTSVARPADAGVPREPRLQPFPEKDGKGDIRAPYQHTPEVDMELMRAREQQALENPGWVDREKGVVRLPIAVAKQIALQRIQSAAPASAATPAPPAATAAAPPAAPATPATTTSGAAH